ncbi:guanine nucleotide-binding protein G(O) subunit alpha-like [Elysia marginata]|uniref:Guanine nucleotide-binding protein G(O) subunit alpha-like n=1 Tax=Elysia marginata TaxID=1093978 RepID=A0AAV4H7G0_9GAST|nr:guanine nucleotide-binding protein G(O) subunit alpha-like [Elysia marginata]
MGLCFSLDQEEEKARARSDAIDQRLQKWAKDESNVLNILLLAGQYTPAQILQRGRVVSASDSRSGGRGFDSRPCHVAISLEKQFTLTFPSPPTCKMGTQLHVILKFCDTRLQHPAYRFKVAFKCTGLLGH